MSTVLHRCACRHAFQDSAYGDGVRVHNPVGDKDKKVVRCTVCSHEVSLAREDKKAAAKEDGEAKGKKGKKSAA